MKTLNEKIIETGNRAYIYSIDNLSFAKTLQKNDFGTAKVNELVEISGKLSVLIGSARLLEKTPLIPPFPSYMIPHLPSSVMGSLYIFRKCRFKFRNLLSFKRAFKLRGYCCDPFEEL